MSLNIQQTIPNTVDILKTTTSSITPKKDLCTGFTTKNLFNTSGLPDLSLPDIDLPDLPSWKLQNSLSMDFIPDFTKFKMDGLSLKGLTNPFECLMKDMSKPDFKSLSYKNDYDKLNNSNCTDKTAGTNTDSMKNSILKSALNMDNCSKEDAQAVSDLANDLESVGINTSEEDKNITKTLVSSIVDNKLDIGTASTLLNDDAIVSKMNASIITSSTSFDKIMKVGKKTNLVKDKDPIVDFATRLSDSKDIAKTGKNPVVALAVNASKDSQSSLTSLPSSRTNSNSQKISLLAKANNIKNKSVFFDLKSMIA